MKNAVCTTSSYNRGADFLVSGHTSTFLFVLHLKIYIFFARYVNITYSRIHTLSSFLHRKTRRKILLLNLHSHTRKIQAFLSAQLKWLSTFSLKALWWHIPCFMRFSLGTLQMDAQLYYCSQVEIDAYLTTKEFYGSTYSYERNKCMSVQWTSREYKDYHKIKI